jgi:hypothetical protein
MSTAGDEAAPVAAITETDALPVSDAAAAAEELAILTSPNTRLAAAADHHVLDETVLTSTEAVATLTSPVTGPVTRMQYGDLSYDMEAGNQSGREKRPIATPDGSPMKTSTHTTPQDKKKVKVGVNLPPPLVMWTTSLSRSVFE